ncbi:hypothetical protein [Erythrobacter crassostreae]|uniref:Uncharacterized protein n=1 Tax=Erythrobacter crassostreae TaxID=2828328 RepID=A0A9X1F2G2_9SPHN|nr:hypothetical protein [Erythrobacter crassostrea]MBV7259077.1 hypothetical protein [Erythrobacter crassostrea]
MMKALALIALIQLGLGPLQEDERTLTVSLCLGGEITIPIGDEKDQRKRGCHQSACHAGNPREKANPSPKCRGF